MGNFAIKAIGFLIVVAVIFGAGVFVGGGFATEAAETSQQSTVEACLPVKDVAALKACLTAGDQ